MCNEVSLTAGHEEAKKSLLMQITNFKVDIKNQKDKPNLQ